MHVKAEAEAESVEESHNPPQKAKNSPSTRWNHSDECLLLRQQIAGSSIPAFSSASFRSLFGQSHLPLSPGPWNTPIRLQVEQPKDLSLFVWTVSGNRYRTVVTLRVPSTLSATDTQSIGISCAHWSKRSSKPNCISMAGKRGYCKQHKRC